MYINKYINIIFTEYEISRVITNKSNSVWNIKNWFNCRNRKTFVDKAKFR